MFNLFETTGLMPHGYCLLWKPWLVTLHAGADAIIFASYFIIPLAILRFLRARPDVRFGPIGMLFAAFILLCGLTHLIGLITLWYPVYELQGVIKMLTALVSAATALIVFPLVPRLVALPSPRELEEANRRLSIEIARHEETLAELQVVRARLEDTVDERTRELKETADRLTVVTRETVHRAKNLLTVVQSIARQSATYADTKEELVATFSGRMASLARALSTVVERGTGNASLREIVETQLQHYRETYPDRLEIDGEDIEVRGEAAQQIGLGVHELATNAVKHGALSDDRGHVRVSWRRVVEGDAEMLDLVWQESGAPARDDRPAGPGGFGSLLLNRAVPTQLRGRASSEMAAQGFRYRLTVPLSELTPRTRSYSDDEMVRAFPLGDDRAPA